MRKTVAPRRSDRLLGRRIQEVESRVVVAEVGEKRRRAGVQLLAAIGPEIALLVVVSLWASTFIVMTNAAKISIINFMEYGFELRLRWSQGKRIIRTYCP